MEVIAIRALQLILSISLLVLIHEFGHFIFARIFKIKVEKFYLFFDPWFSLFKFKPKNSDTEYGIGWLPLGGYVKISGMIDESMDREQLAKPAQPWEFRSKPAWQRLLVMVGGVVMNFILAFFIYSMILFAWGESYIPLSNAKFGMEFSQTAKNVGFEDGDILVSADGKTLERFGEATIREVAEAKEVTVLRDGKDVRINMPADFMQQLIRDKQGFANFIVPMEIREVVANSPAAIAKLEVNDRIVAINQVPTPSILDVQEQFLQNKSKTVDVQLERNDQYVVIPVTLDSLGHMGIYMKPMDEVFDVAVKKYSFFESFPAGVKMGIGKLTGYVSDLKYVFTKEGASSVGGFGTIAKLFPEVFNAYAFWSMTAFLSIMLGVMNILPIPALDGGHVLFLLYEVITRRKPNEKFIEYAQMIGMVLLFGLLIFANGNDLFRAIFG